MSNTHSAGVCVCVRVRVHVCARVCVDKVREEESLGITWLSIVTTQCESLFSLWKQHENSADLSGMK